MPSSCDYTYCHDDLDPDAPYLGPFESPGARLLLQAHHGVWLIHWYANSCADLLVTLNRALNDTQLHNVTLQMEYLPPEFESELMRSGWRAAGEFVDAWIDDLSAKPPAPPMRFPVRTMHSSEVVTASRITYACRRQTRGYYGEHPEWIEQWAADPNQRVFLVMDGGRPVGVLFAGLRGFDHARGPVCWVRDMAVLPSFQNRGLGRELLLTALHWGLTHNVARAMLSVDLQNEKAIHLYRSVGFTLRPGRGQINLQCDLP